jgi:hypothetical protein
MTSKQIKVGIVLFTILLVAALLGGNWETSAAQGTVDDDDDGDNERARVPIIPLIPVTSGCDGPRVQAVGGCCVPDGAVIKEQTVMAEVEKNTVGLEQYETFSDVMNCFVEQGDREIKGYRFLKPASVYFELSAYSLDAFKKDGLISIFWFNILTRAWEKIPTTLESGTNRLVAPAVFSGLFLVATPEK